MPSRSFIIGPQKPVFCSENLPGLPGSRDDADELVDGPDRLLGASALGGRRPFLGGEIMESRRKITGWRVSRRRNAAPRPARRADRRASRPAGALLHQLPR